MEIYLSLLVALIGVLMYALCVNPKLNAIGFAMFQCGLLAFLFCICGGSRLLSIVPK